MRGRGIGRMPRALARIAAIALVASALTAAPVLTDAAPASAAAVTPAPGRLHTSGATIRTATGKAYVVRAISWFGLETSVCAPHGLWQISLDQALAHIASMGFNTIRLPFANACLRQTAPSAIDYGRNPSLVGLSPLQLIDRVVARAKVYGLSVILDQHRPDTAAQSELWYSSTLSEAQWLADWRMLAKRYRSSTNVIGVDLHNEPHGSACWGCGDRSRDWRAAATRAGNAVLAIDPTLLVIVEGTDQGAAATTWWGGGLAAAVAKPVRLAVAHRVVYSPHEYPSTVYAQPWFASSAYPANLPGIWKRNWGVLDARGIAPVLVGEFGTKLETRSDRIWLKTLVAYLDRTGMSFSYWSFNPNSGDTGGIVADDWTTPRRGKLALLEPILGRARTVRPIEPVMPTVTGPATAPTTSTTGGTTSPGTSMSSTPTPTGPGTPRTAGPITAQWLLQSSWQSGYVAEFQVTASSAVSGWTVSWANSSATAVQSAWGVRCTLGGGRITCASDGDWASRIPAGGTVRVGLSVVARRAPADPALAITSF